MRNLHDLPAYRDRWSYLFLEYGTLEVTAAGLSFENKSASEAIPINQLSLLMLGPGTTVTHAAVKALAQNNCLLAWVGDEGVRLYTHSTGGTFSSRRMIHQAGMYCDEAKRLEVIKRMYRKRFPDGDLDGKDIQQIRGMEGSRVRTAYAQIADRIGVVWEGRNYNQGNWDHADPLNRALSAANACLYGLCHAAIVSVGYSAALGFIHTGKMLSFVYDVADLYKTEITVPLAFSEALQPRDNLERRVRLACRQAFHDAKLMNRIIPDIAEVLDAGDDLGESPEEFEGRAISLAVGAPAGGLPGQPEQAGARPAVDQGQEADQGGERDADLELPF